jgi:hypothetical protein
MSAATMTVANEILTQLGGNRFVGMTGAKNILGGENYIMFSIPKGKDKSNKMRITLDFASDTYTVETFSIRGIECNAKTTLDMVYGDQLRAVFTSITGFDTSL